MRTCVVDRRAVRLGGRWRWRYHAEIPVAIVFQAIQYVLSVWVDQVGPRLPKRMDNVVDEPDLGE